MQIPVKLFLGLLSFFACLSAVLAALAATSCDIWSLYCCLFFTFYFCRMSPPYCSLHPSPLSPTFSTSTTKGGAVRVRHTKPALWRLVACAQVTNPAAGARGRRASGEGGLREDDEPARACLFVCRREAARRDKRAYDEVDRARSGVAPVRRVGRSE